MTPDHPMPASEVVNLFEVNPAERQMIAYRKWLDCEIVRAFSINPRLLRGMGSKSLEGWGPRPVGGQVFTRAK